MFQLFGKKKNEEIDANIYAPVNGTCISLDDVKDAVFAQRMMGEGIAFNFEGDTIYSPVDGEVVMVANTSHAFGIKGNNNVEILIHVGLDTVNLNGQGLEVLVNTGQKLKKGTPLLKIDRAFMKEQNIDLTTPMIITNSKDYTLLMEHINDKVNIEDIVIKIK